MSADKILEEAAATFKSRNAEYGSAYTDFGVILKAFFPDGAAKDIKSEEDWSRFGVFVLLVGKMQRYAKNFGKGGHYDSALDAAAYSAMLADLTKKPDEISDGGARETFLQVERDEDLLPTNVNIRLDIQPIDLAPKDGRYFLAIPELNSHPFLCRWNEVKKCWVDCTNSFRDPSHWAANNFLYGR